MPEGKRKCVICGKTQKGNEGTYGFAHTLRDLGYQGDKAHPSCITAESKRRKDRELKTGRRG